MEVMRRWLVVALALTAGCAPSASAAGVGARSRQSFVQVNLAGGYADGARAHGVDDVVLTLVRKIRDLPRSPAAVFLNEACEKHAVDVATLLGDGWRAFFVPSWPGHSDCV